jgi:hypothetical protein
VDHIEHRVNAGRHINPSQFIVGDLNILREIIENVLATKLTFEIYGVQPGISQAAINNHLADLMAFGLDYVHRGGAAQAGWITSV